MNFATITIVIMIVCKWLGVHGVAGTQIKRLRGRLYTKITHLIKRLISSVENSIVSSFIIVIILNFVVVSHDSIKETKPMAGWVIWVIVTLVRAIGFVYTCIIYVIIHVIINIIIIAIIIIVMCRAGSDRIICTCWCGVSGIRNQLIQIAVTIV